MGFAAAAIEASGHFGPELTEEASVVGPHELLDKPSRSSNLNMFMRSETTRAPFDLSSPLVSG
jgi:hypothetical protein